MTDFKRRNYFVDDNFKVYLEEIDGNVFIHVAINKISTSIFKQIKSVWAEIVVKMYFLGYEELFAYTQDNRVVKMIGGADKVGTYKGYEVWKWELN